MTTVEAPSPADIEALARRVVDRLPRHFRRELGSVVLRVEEFPDAHTAAAMRLGSPFDLLGLYRGVPLPQQSVSDPLPQMEMIFLYRSPILAYCRETGETLARVVRHVVIHEIGHHFGFSDADMARIESAR